MYIVNRLEDNIVLVPGGFVSSQAATVSYKDPQTLTPHRDGSLPFSHPLHSSLVPTSDAIDDCKSFQTAIQLPAWLQASLPLLKQAPYQISHKSGIALSSSAQPHAAIGEIIFRYLATAERR